MSRVSGSQEERIAELEQALGAKEAEIERLKREVHLACDNNHQRNVSLDALHYVWCDGGCEGGVHRFGEHPPLTEEIVRAAIRNTQRLVGWFENKEYRKLSSAEIKTRWERKKELEQRAEAAEAALEAAKLDTERLDAVEQGHWSVSIISRAGRWVVQRETQVLGNIGSGRTPRAAIDAARESGKEPA